MRILAALHDDVERAHALRRRRLALSPALVERLARSSRAPWVAALDAYDWARLDPDDSSVGPVIWFRLHRLFAAVAAGGSADAPGKALVRALAWAGRLDAKRIDFDSDSAVEALRTWPADFADFVSDVGLGDTAWRQFTDNLAAGLRLLGVAGARVAPPQLARLRWVAPLIELEPGRHSASVAHLPDVVFVGAGSSPALMAELVLHECLHLMLHDVVEVRPLVADRMGDERFYSPWRVDPRPAEAVLHGAFVFAGVTLFWLRQLDIGGDHKGYATERVATATVQLEAASLQLALHAAGDLVEAVLAYADAAIAIAREADIPPALWSRAERIAADHFDRWSAANPVSTLAGASR